MAAKNEQHTHIRCRATSKWSMKIGLFHAKGGKKKFLSYYSSIVVVVGSFMAQPVFNPPPFSCILICSTQNTLIGKASIENVNRLPGNLLFAQLIYWGQGWRLPPTHFLACLLCLLGCCEKMSIGRDYVETHLVTVGIDVSPLLGIGCFDSVLACFYVKRMLIGSSQSSRNGSTERQTACSSLPNPAFVEMDKAGIRRRNKGSCIFNLFADRYCGGLCIYFCHIIRTFILNYAINALSERVTK